MFQIYEGSLFDTEAEAYVNTINCVGVMGAGIAKVFKEKYPLMFMDYRSKCDASLIKPGSIYVYRHDNCYLLGAAVKDDWQHWTTHEWIMASLKSLQAAVVKLGIKSVNLPLFGSKNGQRGPRGPVENMLLPPDASGILKLTVAELRPFAEKHGINVRLYLKK